MDRTTKERLAAIKRERREKIVLLKDVTPEALVIYAVDHFNEHADPSTQSDPMTGYLKYASKEQVDALKRYLPHREVVVGAGFGNRTVTVFQYARLVWALRALVTCPYKYFKAYDRLSQLLEEPRG